MRSEVEEAVWSGFSAAELCQQSLHLSEDTCIKAAEGSGRPTVQQEQLSHVVQPWHLSQEQLSPMMADDVVL